MLGALPAEAAPEWQRRDQYREETAVNFVAARPVADAVMFEGYRLDPNRESAVANKSRWQLGVLMPPAYAAEAERSFAQTECVLEHGASPTIAAIIRFLQVQRRTGGEPAEDETADHEIAIRVDGARLSGDGHVTKFEIPGGEKTEGDVVRVRQPLSGTVSLVSTPLPGPWGAARLRVRLDNRTAADPVARTRHEAMPAAMVAAHMMIGVRGGAFISVSDPPAWADAAVRACENVGCRPVLAGVDGGRGVILCTPVAMADHPRLGPDGQTRAAT
jgi:hypothetical protein